MAIEAVAFGKSLSVLSLSMNYAQYEIPSMDLIVPLREIAGQDVYFEDIEFYRDGQLIESGFIRTPIIVPDLSDSVAKVRLRCQNDLGRLECELPVNVRLDNALSWTAIHYLLSTAQQDTWVFGDNRAFNPLTSPDYANGEDDYKITIDLSDAQNLWEQLVKIGKSAQGRRGLPIFYRAGAARGENGFYQLDMGYFGEKAKTNRIVKGQNTLGAANINAPTREPLKGIAPAAGDDVVTLSDALNIDPSLATDTNYPLDAATESVINNTITKGCLSKRKYADVKPPSASPTATELNQAALTLYYSARQDIIDSMPYMTMTQRCFLESPPRLHELIWFDNIVNEYEYDLYTRRFQVVESYRLQEWMRIVGIKMDYRERYEKIDPYTGQRVPAEIYELELTSSDIRDIYNPNIVLYNELKPETENTVGLVINENINFSSLPDASVTYSGIVGDCDFNGDSTGKSFFLANPLAPMGAFVLPLLDSPTVPSYETTFPLSYSRLNAYRLKVTTPATLTESLSLCASGHGGETWDTDDDLEISARYIYYNVT